MFYTIPLTAISIPHTLTDLTLRAIEATGTGADVGLDAGSSIQTDRVTESCGRHKHSEISQV